ncbi:hypothetical protein KFU94_42715 [Chloroflexi bacterium TSY]|nr:hypothetical protein [Chloroflexi bacterium TSY]
MADNHLTNNFDIPTDGVVELTDSSEINGDISDPQTPDWYYLAAGVNRTVTISFQGPKDEYVIKHIQKSRSKGGTVNGHEEDVPDVQNYSFEQTFEFADYLRVASATPDSWPSAGYTIRMTVEDR